MNRNRMLRIVRSVNAWGEVFSLARLELTRTAIEARVRDPEKSGFETPPGSMGDWS